MKQSIKMAGLIMIIGVTLISCGPRRYRCGPYRKCEIKEQKSSTQEFVKTTKAKKMDS